jgi:glycosyltransferase involved in cell wall biosynthesis
MRIGIDARELTGRATGAGRYLAGLLGEWLSGERARRHEFVLYAHQPLIAFAAAPAPSTQILPGSGGTSWEQWRLPRALAADRLDVFFAPAYTAPLMMRVPLVVAIHDVSFSAHPEWFRPREGLRRRCLSQRAARRARTVITISEFSRSELIGRLGVRTDRIRVIPPGVTSPAAPRRATCPDQRILFVGSVFNRRHVPDLIRAFGRLARTHPAALLTIVGDDRTYPHEDIPLAINREGLNGRVEWRQYVCDDELSELYATSRAFAFLSEYEGLGLTPLEALAAGVPPVLLDTPVAREACGDAALYVQPGDAVAVEAALERLLFDEVTRAALLGAAPRVLARYDWRKAALETLSVLEAAASPPVSA